MIAEMLATLERTQPMELAGTVREVRGLTVLVDDLPLPVGATVAVRGGEGERLGEVVGFANDQTIVMLMGSTTGIRRGAEVVGRQSAATGPVGDDLLGRVVNALGEPIDDGPAIRETVGRPIQPDPLSAMSRVPTMAACGPPPCAGARARPTRSTSCTSTAPAAWKGRYRSRMRQFAAPMTCCCWDRTAFWFPTTGPPATRSVRWWRMSPARPAAT